MSHLPPTADSLLSRFLGKPARICPVCSGKRFRLNPAGAVLCTVCKPADPTYPELIAEFSGRPLRCVWTLPSEGFDDPVVPSERTRENGNGGAGCGVGLAAGVAERDGWGDPESRPDPDNGPSELVIVSTRLEWCTARTDGYWENPESEICCLPSPGVPGAPAGIWRSLTQPLFGWLVGQCLKLPETDRTEAMRLMREIAVEAVGCGVFGLWALEVDQWPWAAPAGFSPPVFTERRQFWDWDRGVSGRQLGDLVGFQPGSTGGKELQNGNGSSGANDGRGNRNHGGGNRRDGGIRRDGLFADECPD